MTECKADPILCSGASIRRQAILILMGWGMPRDDAEITAAALSDCDLRGVETHGISLLALYAQWMRQSPFNLAVKSRIVRDGPGFALLDAQGNLGYAVSVRAVELAVAKARDVGIAGVGVCNSRHFGAAGYYARLGARAGVIMLVTTSTRVVCVVPPGGAEPMLGTNPLAYGIPRHEGEPIVFDVATSTVSGNRVRVHSLKDRPLPTGWIVDAEGEPVTDPHQGNEIVFKTGAGGITPLGANAELGSHKGYGLALLVHFLGGALTGASFVPARNPSRPTVDVGHYFLAIDPAIYRDMAAFHEDVEEVAQTLRATRPAVPDRAVTLPGDNSNRVFEERSANGVPLAATLVGQLAALSRDLGVPFHLNDEAGLER